MVTPNYAFAKRQRELAQKQKKEEKLKRKADAQTSGEPPSQDAQNAPAPAVENDSQ